jgi:hypothetical protein
LVPNTCIVACQTNNLRCRVGKRAYALVEYDLHHEPLNSMKGQIVADFIIEHRVDDLATSFKCRLCYLHSMEITF